MASRKSVRRAAVLSIAAAAISSGSAYAQQLTLQHTNSIDLSGIFFGPGNHGVGSPSSGFGSNPLSVAFDGTNAYIGGYNGFTSVDGVGVAEITNVLAPTTGSTTLASTVQMTDVNGNRGINDIAYDPSTQKVFFAFDSGTAGTPGQNTGTASVIARIDPSTGTVDQTRYYPDGQRPVALSIDPLGASGAPSVAYLSRGNGRELTLDKNTLLEGYTINGSIPGVTTNAGPIINGKPTAFGSTWRSMNFDASGNLVTATGSSTGSPGGPGGVLVGLRTNNNTFSTIVGATGGAQTVAITKSATTDNIGNGTVLVNGLVTGATGFNSDLIVFAAPTPGTGHTQTLTDSSGNAATIDTRQIQIRRIDGTTTGLSQSTLNGGEDDLGSTFTSDLKNFAVGKDANGLPVILSVDFNTKRLDVYSVEPTWTAGGGTFGTPGNWLLNIVPNSQMLNAKFGTQTSPTTITVGASTTTKDLKIDSATGSYTFNGPGAIILNGPDTHTANIQVISGNHTIAAPVSLINAGGVDMLISSGSLTLNGPLSGNANLNKIGAGTLFINGDNSANFSGTSSIRGGTVVIANSGALGNENGNLTVSGGTLRDTTGFTTSRGFIIGANGATIDVVTGTEIRSNGFGGAGPFTKLGVGALQVSPFTVTGLTVAAGTMRIRANENTTSIVTSLNVGDNTSATAAKLDLNDEDMVVEYSTGGPSPIDTVRTLLTAGFNKGSWNGNGIASLAAHNNASQTTGLGYGENSELGQNVFGTVLVDANSLLLKYTYYGDNNLDGVVDGSDFSMFLDGLAGSGSAWTQGDYTYDGVVDLGNDFNLFLTNYIAGGSPLGALAGVVEADTQLSSTQKAALLSVVPEPSSIAGLTVAAAALATRRRKQMK